MLVLTTERGSFQDRLMAELTVQSQGPGTPEWHSLTVGLTHRDDDGGVPPSSLE